MAGVLILQCLAVPLCGTAPRRGWHWTWLSRRCRLFQTSSIHGAQAKQLRQHNSLFLIACARGLVQDCKQLLDWGAQPGVADKQGLTSAHFAAAHGKTDLLAFLWSKGVELDAEDPGVCHILLRTAFHRL